MIAIGSTLLVIATTLGAGAVLAQGFPSKPMRMVVPYPPGGATDVITRTLAQKMSESLKQPMIADNRGGGGQVIGTDIVAKSPPDGHTLLLASVTHSINPSLVPQLPYDTVRDFTPVSFVGSSPLVLVVNPVVPARNVGEFIALARAQPGKMNYASSGNGSGGHLTMEVLKNQVGIDLVHVPYKGGGPAITDLISGLSQAMITSPIAVVSFVRAGKLRMLGVTSKARSVRMPDVPTLAETGVTDFESSLWYAIVGPRGVPREAVLRLNTAIRDALAAADVREKFLGNDIEAQSSSPDELTAYINTEVTKWRTVIQRANISL